MAAPAFCACASSWDTIRLRPSFRSHSNDDTQSQPAQPCARFSSTFRTILGDSKFLHKIISNIDDVSGARIVSEFLKLFNEAIVIPVHVNVLMDITRNRPNIWITTPAAHIGIVRDVARN